MEIQKNASVVIEYRVRLPDGSYVKGEKEPESLNFIVGYNQVLPALEQQLLGLTEGCEVEFTIPAQEAFGEHNPALVKWKSFEEFPEGRNLQPGRWVMATNPDRGVRFGYFVVRKDDNGVLLDYNHPLAGKDLHYKVKVVHVRPALPDELEFLRPCEFKDSKERR